jgi:hypothetical protein
MAVTEERINEKINNELPFDNLQYVERILQHQIFQRILELDNTNQSKRNHSSLVKQIFIGTQQLWAWNFRKSNSTETSDSIKIDEDI